MVFRSVSPSPKPSKGSWILAEELMEAGDPAFVTKIERIQCADRLGKFAAGWPADQRSASRRLLIEYLKRPFAVYLHEALVKRLAN